MDPAGNLRNDIQEALDRQRLTDWQRKFLTDIHSRLERSNGQATLSDKQWQKVFEILGRQASVNAPTPAIRLNRRQRATTPHISRPRFRHSRRYLPRQTERLLAGLAVVAVIAVLQFSAGTGAWQGQTATP